ncbi:MAG: EF-hand domain-containing protein, partial [Gammaproteobacteria bacterium]
MTPQRLIIIFAMLLALPVNADELVDRADANGDGYVSLYELRAAYYADMEFNQRIEQSFAEYDTDGDGLISEAERQAQALAAAATAAETTQKTAPRAGMAATASGEGAVAPVTGTAPAAAAGTSSAPPAATVTTSPAGLAPTPPAGLTAAAATETPAAPAAETVSVETPGMDTG